MSREGKPVTPKANPLETCDTPSAGAYAASNIVILGASERISDPMFDWELAEDLAHEFNRPVEWVRRGNLACREAGVSPEYFIDRYILKKPIPMNEEVDRVALSYW